MRKILVAVVGLIGISALAVPAAHAVNDPLSAYFGTQVDTPYSQVYAEFHCLALNVYHEARGEEEAGRLAVAAVTLNRVRSPRFPSTVCDVVWQRMQFSWTQDGRPDRPYEMQAWAAALEIAARAYWDGEPSNVGNATFYHSEHITPHWAQSVRLVARIGKHMFYASEG